MIPQAHITEWRSHVPWIDDAQVEQDLVISRLLVEIFSDEAAKVNLAFRGGTALNKLYFQPASRYSEDIDLVQVPEGPVGPVANPMQNRFVDLLGRPKYQARESAARMLFRFESEIAPVVRLRLKVEINTREHFSVLPIETRTFELESRWFSGRAEIPTYQLDELIGTKMRALYQRRKGRDLFDLWVALQRSLIDPDRVVSCFLAYIEAQHLRVSRAEYEANLAAKVEDRRFLRDTAPLLAPGVAYDPVEAYTAVMDVLVTRLPGSSWKGGAAPTVSDA